MHSSIKTWRFVGSLLAVAMVLAGCGGSTATTNAPTTTSSGGTSGVTAASVSTPAMTTAPDTLMATAGAPATSVAATSGATTSGATVMATSDATMAATGAATMMATSAPEMTTSATTSGTTGAAAGAGAALSWKGTITMYAQEYTPNKKDAKHPLKAFRQLADAYEQAHPGIKIDFPDIGGDGYNDIVRVKAAAGELPDIYWAQWASLNSTLPKGIAVDLRPYFAQKNPYIPDAATWQDAMNTSVVNQTAAPDAAKYNLNGDFVATAFFYNKDLFQKAGITDPPKSWQELLDVSKKLKAAHITAAVGVPLYGWWERHWLSDFYAKDYDAITGADKAPGMSGLDEAVAINKGILSTKDPRFMAWWPIFKQLTDTWNQDYLTQPPDNNTAAEQDFIGGKAAMYYSGSWFPNKIRDANPNFNFGSFNFPQLSTAVSQYSNGTNTSNAVGGPNAGYQYAIATPQSDKSMAEPGKLEAVLDWARYFGTPKNVEQVVNEDGSFIPTWNGTKPKAGSELLSSQANQKLRVLQTGQTSAELDNEQQSIFGLFLSGNATLEQSTTAMQQAIDKALKDYVTKNKVDLSTYK